MRFSGESKTAEKIATGKAVLSYICELNHIVFVPDDDIELVELLGDTCVLCYFNKYYQRRSDTF
jgi:hypothetical protein